MGTEIVNFYLKIYSPMIPTAYSYVPHMPVYSTIAPVRTYTTISHVPTVPIVPIRPPVSYVASPYSTVYVADSDTSSDTDSEISSRSSSRSRSRRTHYYLSPYRTVLPGYPEYGYVYSPVYERRRRHKKKNKKPVSPDQPHQPHF
eukprot:TRINITY_DN475_c0_g1_i1.p1 TRINITY_DN475_c0_g1~~TRINITY_DN475_c0_g1_i1.p1  ORF type:complete len:145 (+),score=2.01 TRINITY_DN475_c0_g1_i1:104-538(+)